MENDDAGVHMELRTDLEHGSLRGSRMASHRTADRALILRSAQSLSLLWQRELEGREIRGGWNCDQAGEVSLLHMQCAYP